MRIFRNECAKVIRSPMVMILFIWFLLLNAVLLYTSEPENGIPAESYKKAYTYFLDGTQEKIEELKGDYQQLYSVLFEGNIYDEENQEIYTPVFTDNIWTEYEIIRDFNTEIGTVEGYQDYLEQMKQQTEKTSVISIFSNRDTYAVKEANKTAQVFDVLATTKPFFVNSRTFLEAVDFHATDFLVLLVLFSMLYYLLIWEREQGLFSLQMTMLHGRSSLMTAKAMALFSGSVFVNLIFWGSNLLVASKKYGQVQFDAPIQSIAGFNGCALPITIGQYWIIFLVIKIVVCFSVSVLFLYFTARVNQLQNVWLIAGILFGCSYALYHSVDGKSAIAFLKYCNLIPVLNVNDLLRYYFNLNFIGTPVAAWWMIGIFCLILLLVFGGLLLVQANPIYMLTNHKKKVQNRGVNAVQPQWGLLRYEAYKSMILQKGLLILCCFLAFQVFSTVTKDTNLSYQDRIYKSYMEQMEGSVTEKKRTWIIEERERLDQYNAIFTEAKENYENKKITDQEWNSVQQLVSTQTEGQEAFALIEQRLDYLEDFYKQTGIDLGFVYEHGYEYLSANSYSGNKNDQFHAMLLLAVTILILAPLFSMEYTGGMIKLLAVCKNGRHITIRKKLELAFGICVILFLSVYLTDLIYTICSYGLPSLSAYCASVPSMEAYGTITLLQYLGLLYLIRFVGYLCIVLLFLLVSVLVKNTVKSIIAGLLLFIFPLFTAMLGISQVDFFTFNMFITGNQYLRLAANGKAFVLCVPIAIGIAARILLSLNVFQKP